MVYELKPGLDGRFQDQPLKTNSHGMRDREYPREKPDGVVRIAGLGDSVMFGWGVGQGEAYLDVLERLDRGTGEREWVETFQVSRRDAHPNRRGHELYAEALWRELRRSMASAPDWK